MSESQAEPVTAASDKDGAEKKHQPDSTNKNSERQTNDVNWGMPETNHLPYEDQPSPGTTEKQKSGAV